ncbi:MAG: hypothetical protein ACI9EK_001033 [Psychroserpens sp.]|jgi:hypothetical protein
MKLFNKSIFITLATIITLSACGGGGDKSADKSNNSNSSNSGNSGSATISGQFFSSHDTDSFFATEKNPEFSQYGKSAKHCYQSFNDYYFETDNTMVFGNPNLPESDFKQAATWVENNLNSALNSMGITKAEYFEARYSVRIAGLKQIRNRLIYKEYDNFSYPNEFNNWSDQEQVDWATKTVKAMSSEEAVNLLSTDSFSPFQIENGALLEEKIYVCLHENESTWGFGEGFIGGLSIGAASIVTPNKVEQLIQHELIHSIQQALSHSLEENSLPHWFKEGQAVVLSGQSIAKQSDHNESDPTLVVNYFDQSGDVNDAYEHYGLAYKYLMDANGQSSIVDMLRNIKGVSYDYSKQLSSELNEYHGYVEVFNATMKQKNGNSLSVNEYRDNYHSIMSAY